MEMAFKVALQFSAELRAAVTKAEMLEILERNRAETNPLVCHSHDFLDANEVMDSAFRHVSGFSVSDLQDGTTSHESACEMWGKAWNLARALQFFFDAPQIEDIMRALGLGVVHTGGNCRAYGNEYGQLALIIADDDAGLPESYSESFGYQVTDRESGEIFAQASFDNGLDIREIAPAIIDYSRNLAAHLAAGNPAANFNGIVPVKTESQLIEAAAELSSLDGAARMIQNATGDDSGDIAADVWSHIDDSVWPEMSPASRRAAVAELVAAERAYGFTLRSV